MSVKGVYGKVSIFSANVTLHFSVSLSQPSLVSLNLFRKESVVDFKARGLMSYMTSALSSSAFMQKQNTLYYSTLFLILQEDSKNFHFFLND